jgi:uncharacterized RDD family membrane protein YckC
VIATAQPNAPDVPYAGIVTRAVAFVIDLLILNGVLFGGALVVGLVISAFGHFAVHFDLTSATVAGAVWALAFTVYFTSWWSLTGQTPGMRALGIKVVPVEDDGARIRPRRGLLRVAGMALAAIPLFAGYLLILVQSRRQGLHDLLARTFVYYSESERPPPPYRGAG